MKQSIAATVLCAALALAAPIQDQDKRQTITAGETVAAINDILGTSVEIPAPVASIGVKERQLLTAGDAVVAIDEITGLSAEVPGPIASIGIKEREAQSGIGGGGGIGAGLGGLIGGGASTLNGVVKDVEDGLTKRQLGSGIGGGLGGLIGGGSSRLEGVVNDVVNDVEN